MVEEKPKRKKENIIDFNSLDPLTLRRKKKQERDMIMSNLKHTDLNLDINEELKLRRIERKKEAFQILSDSSYSNSEKIDALQELGFDLEDQFDLIMEWEEKK